MKYLSKIMLPAAMALLSVSCNHKDLVYDTQARSEVIVVYDWRNAPDANPASMELRLHPNNDPENVVNFFFQNATGGPLRAPVGDYTAVTLNADLTDWAMTRNHNDADAFELYTADAQVLENTGIAPHGVPRAEGTETERVALTPGMIWADRADGIGIHNTPGVQTITFYPEELVCHYTVDILDIKHIENLRSPGVDATISGMAEAVRPGRKEPTEASVTMPFTLQLNSDGTAMHGEFLTFGEPKGDKKTHMITIYITLTDGTKWYANVDVSQQVYDAPDFRHVHIVIDGADFPTPSANMGAIIPEVEEWQSVNIDLKM